MDNLDNGQGIGTEPTVINQKAKTAEKDLNSEYTPSDLMGKKSNLGRLEFAEEAFLAQPGRGKNQQKRSFITKLDMEGAIKTVVMQYLSSARGKESLGGKNFQKLVQGQLGNIMSNTESSSAVKEMMKGLDDNQDGKVSFAEYLTLVGYLANSLSDQKASGQEDKH